MNPISFFPVFRCSHARQRKSSTVSCMVRSAANRIGSGSRIDSRQLYVDVLQKRVFSAYSRGECSPCRTPVIA
jgi:hypothetical protein